MYWMKQAEAIFNEKLPAQDKQYSFLSLTGMSLALMLFLSACATETSQQPQSPARATTGSSGSGAYGGTGGSGGRAD